MKRTLFLLSLLALLCFSGCGNQTAQVSAVSSGQLNYSDLTIKAIQTLTDGNTSDFYQLFDDNMKESMTEQELQDSWRHICAQYGAFQYYLSEVAISNKDTEKIASIPCIFEQGTLTFRITFNNNGNISGFYITEGDHSSGSPRLSNDTEISFGAEPYLLSGSLSLPQGAGPFPVVILLQESGPYDRNEQVGPNLPFLDMADQLTQHGVAVLRYDKRTYLYSTEIAQEDTFTVYDEIIDDVALAVDFLKTLNTIQSDAIFIAGHGISGYLMPRIAEQTPEAAGYIMLAASARPLEDLLLTQTQYVLDTETNLEDAAKEQMLQQTKETVNRIKNLTEESTYPAKDLYLLPVSYWLDLQNYDPLSQIQQIDKPLLFIQGGRDYQTTKTDFELWKSVLDESKRIHFRYYDNLNHIFMTGTGKSTPAEYQQKGTVSADVCKDMIDFVKKHS